MIGPAGAAPPSNTGSSVRGAADQFTARPLPESVAFVLVLITTEAAVAVAVKASMPVKPARLAVAWAATQNRSLSRSVATAKPSTASSSVRPTSAMPKNRSGRAAASEITAAFTWLPSSSARPV